MKTASVRDLRNHYTSLLRWIDAGEDVLITKRGKVIARLSPETEQAASKVDWKNSPEVSRSRDGEVSLSAEISQAVRRDAQGSW